MQTFPSHPSNAARAKAPRCMRMAIPARMRLRSDACVGVHMVRVKNLHVHSPVRANTNNHHYHFHSYQRSIYACQRPIFLLNSAHLGITQSQTRLIAGKQIGPSVNAIKAIKATPPAQAKKSSSLSKPNAGPQRMCNEMTRVCSLHLGELVRSIVSGIHYCFDSYLRSIVMRYKAFLLSISEIAKRMSLPVYCPT
jgi:hypothetical protein